MCRVELILIIEFFLFFRTKLSNHLIYDLDGKILVNNNLYVIKSYVTKKEILIKKYSEINFGEANPYISINEDCTTISLDATLFELSLEGASLLGSFWSNPEAFIKSLNKNQKIKKLKID